MRIAFLTNVVYPFVTGGAEKRIHEIGSRLASDGHEITVYGRHFWDGPEVISHEGMTLRAVAPSAELYTDDRRSIPEAIDFAARAVRPLRHQLARHRHDLIDVSAFPYFPIFSASLARIGTDTPVVTTWHEIWLDYWEEYLGMLAPFGKAVERVTARMPQHPVAVSGITADRLAEIGPARESIDVVPNGIDIDQIQHASLPQEQASFDVLFAGRLIDDKNVSLLLDAFDKVADAHDATLGIIGEGPELDRLEAQAERLAHSNRITFLGFLEEYEEVLGQMRAAKVFASPSTREGFGITFAEAMAADCTVIAADHPESAASEVIGDAGYVVEPTAEAIASALERALSGERPPIEPTERAKQYDWDRVAEQAETVYRRAIETNR
ncbi:glycosyltransferase family 4 protein [Halalkalicoccus subterraneus]|uniref:glycosyltransferase family 4 protein n=1 Tax=Halalkalicoccus subterraneus TaxID=2675002 RepID=UPI000EFAC9D2|nr:glycosyltransferase family 4 protein [Halalkalicoccus subterraneus]